MSGGYDDGFETASDPDDEKFAVLEQNLSPRKPIAQRTEMDNAARDENPIVVVENPSLADEGEVSVTFPACPKGFLIENPNWRRIRRERFWSWKRKGLRRLWFPRILLIMVFPLTNFPIVDEPVGPRPENVVVSSKRTAGGVEENGVLDARDENLGDDDSEATESPVIVGWLLQKPAAVKSDAVGVVDWVENWSTNPHDGKDEILEETTSLAIEGAAVSKHVDVGSDAVGVVIVAQEQHGENLGGVGSEEVTSSAVKGTSDSKLLGRRVSCG